MRFGVSTDQAFHAIKDGKAVNNLYAVGSILSGHNQLKQADGTGVSMLTALQVAKNILN
jgi:glycerol-3-phosphate dehydrogenase subunit B